MLIKMFVSVAARFCGSAADGHFCSEQCTLENALGKVDFTPNNSRKSLPYAEDNEKFYVSPIPQP